MTTTMTPGWKGMTAEQLAQLVAALEETAATTTLPRMRAQLKRRVAFLRRQAAR